MAGLAAGLAAAFTLADFFATTGLAGLAPVFLTAGRAFALLVGAVALAFLTAVG
jgi:hypothetical protein